MAAEYSQQIPSDEEALRALGFPKDEAWWLLHYPDGIQILNRLKFYKTTLQREDTESHKDVKLSAQSRRLRLSQESRIQEDPFGQLLRLEGAVRSQLQDKKSLEKDAELVNWATQKRAAHHIAAHLKDGHLSVAVFEKANGQQKLPSASVVYGERMIQLHYATPQVSYFYPLQRSLTYGKIPDATPVVKMLLEGASQLLKN